MIIYVKFDILGLGGGAADTTSLAAVEEAMASLLPSVAVEGHQGLPDSEEVVIEEGNIHLDIFTLSVWIIIINVLSERGMWSDKMGG